MTKIKVFTMDDTTEKKTSLHVYQGQGGWTEVRAYRDEKFIGVLQGRRQLKSLAHAILRAIGDEPGKGTP